MMNEEEYLKSRIGQKNPFRVPEGYFDSFSAQMMEQLPERENRSLLRRLRPLMYAAACACVAIFTTAIYLNNADSAADSQHGLTAQAVGESYIDDVADYAMMDNQDIYACLISE